MKCQYFDQKHCMSCDLLPHDYLSSIELKEQVLANLFPDQVGSFKPAVICHPSVDGSRNKAKLAVAMIENQTEFGFYNKNMQFKKLEACPLHASAINNILVVLKQQIETYSILPYDLASKKGELKYVLITYSESMNELLIRFVLRSKESLDRLRKLVVELIKQCPLVKVVTANIQPTHQAILEGEEELVLTEVDCIAHSFDDYTLFQGPRSFFQTNTNVALALYRAFQEELSQLPITSILDLYCGVGAFSFFASKHCDQVLGVEISPSAIEYAKKAKILNAKQDIEFLAMDVGVFLQNQQITQVDAVVVNPPRRGLNQQIIQQLIQLRPTYLFYSSCDAKTMQRDYLLLKEIYTIKSLQLFDMFPFTSHFETLAVLQLT